MAQRWWNDNYWQANYWNPTYWPDTGTSAVPIPSGLNIGGYLLGTGDPTPGPVGEAGINVGGYRLGVMSVVQAPTKQSNRQRERGSRTSTRGAEQR